MNQIDTRLWKVKLVFTNDRDENLKKLSTFMREEIGGDIEWNRLVHLMIKMGEFNKAEEIFRAALESVSAVDINGNATFQNNMGYIIAIKGEKKLALPFYERVLSIYEKSLPSNQLSIALLHNNIGEIHLSMGEYSTALAHFNNTLTIRRQSLSENHPDLARTYNNIGSVYWFMGKYPKSLEYLKKAFEIYKGYFPWNHPELAKSTQ